MDNIELLGLLPPGLRAELLQAFNNITTNFRERKWEPSELNGGKLCEVIYSILDGYVAGTFPPKATKPPNMYNACQLLSNAPTTFPRSVRIHIPRILISLYEVRNNRGVGHIGGDVDPNQMDATLVLYTSKWLMAELIRIFHDVDVNTATLAVEGLIEKEVPTIWQVKNKKRVLNSKLTMKEKTLLLLFSSIGSVDESVLFSWTEHTNAAVFRRDILVSGHKAKLWEYDREAKDITLSPVGIYYVEQNLLK